MALPAFPDSLRDLTDPFDLCLTGEGLEQLRSRDRDRLLRLIPHIQVFARVAPKQKVRGGLGMGIPKIWGLWEPGFIPKKFGARSSSEFPKFGAFRIWE